VHVAILHTGSAVLRMIDRATPKRCAGPPVRPERLWLVGWSATAEERFIDLRQDTILFSTNKSINANCNGKIHGN
jgi:hypothetical protein